MLRFLTVLFALCTMVAASFATITFNVTSPTDGAYIGSTNTIKFIVKQAVFETTIKATIKNVATNAVTTIEQRFTPNASGEIDNSLPLNFNESSPEGLYTIDVTATEAGNPPVSNPTISVTLDRTKPKILEFNPITGAYIRPVPKVISLTVNEANFKEYRVQVNGQDIPNNTGDTLVNGTLNVNWDPSGILFDGAQNIVVTLKDKADNVSTQNISVTLDRIAPSVSIAFPTSNTVIRPKTVISVLVDITDASTSSVDVTGLDVTLTTMSGAFIMRVPRVSMQGTGGSTIRWTGRIQGNKITLPKQFKLVAKAIDKAGNASVVQTTVVSIK